MRIFGKTQPSALTDTTENFFIGLPEAEAEIENDRINLSVVYDDFLNVESELNNGKYIIVGRKGTGKTAITERLLQVTKSDSNTFAEFVKGVDKAFEQSLSGDSPSYGSLFEWIILSRLALMISRDEKLVSDVPQGENIKKFVDQNRTRVNLDGTTVTEIRESNSFNVTLTYLKRASSGYRADIGTSRHQAPYHRVIPFLRDLLTEFLNAAEKVKSNDYLVVFDDLDVGVSANDPKSLDALADLVRVARDYNQNVFARNRLNARVIIMLRKDISNVLRTSYADTAKIFASYGVELNWFEEVGARSASQTKLKKFIDKRIGYNMYRNGLQYDEDNPWDSLFASNVGSYEGGSFNYVVKRTHALPRDLILFFGPLDELKLKIPLSNTSVNKLLIMYSKDKFEEIQNELTFWYHPKTVRKIVQAVNHIVSRKREPFADYDEMVNILKKYVDGSKVDPDEVMERLFEYSVIGNTDSSSGKTIFKHREKRGELLTIKKDWRVVVHRSIEMAITERAV